MSNKKILVLLLACIALLIIWWDYTSAHTLDYMMNLEYCPICYAFQSAEIGVLLIYIIILIGFVFVLYGFFEDLVFLVSSLFDASFTPDRAPPATI